MDDVAVEAISAAVHAAWMVVKQSQGVASSLSESGENLMKPYADLSEGAKDLDRGTVRAVLAALPAAGFGLRRTIVDDPVQRGPGPGTIPPGAMANQEPAPKKPECTDYDGGPNFGLFLNGNPCANCGRRETLHSKAAVAAWEASRQFAPAAPKCLTEGCPGVRDHHGPCLPEMESPCPV